jgi:hypothetical protein
MISRLIQMFLLIVEDALDSPGELVEFSRVVLDLGLFAWVSPLAPLSFVRTMHWIVFTPKR